MNGIIHLGTIEAVPHCSKCGNEDLRMPDDALSNDDLTNDSLITCANCGTVTTYAALVESCEAEVAKNVKDNLGGIGYDPPN